jgi:hypothetical protein
MIPLGKAIKKSKFSAVNKRGQKFKNGKNFPLNCGERKRKEIRKEESPKKEGERKGVREEEEKEEIET